MTPSEFYNRIRFRGNPVAHPDAVVVRGNARFTVLAPRLLRLEWSETGQFEDRCTYAFPTRRADPPPSFTARDEDGALVIDTGALTLRYDRRPLTAAFQSAESAQSAEGKFTAENLSITFTLNGAPVTWMPGLPNPGNLRGTRRTLDGCEGDAALGEGLASRAGWTLFDDSRNVIFDATGWVGPRPDGAVQDWYFFGYGHDYAAAVAEYTRFGGAIPLIPRYILGGWWSRYWAYSAQDLRDLVAEFEAHAVPLDVFVIDMDWHTPDGWTGYTWNRALFPDPSAFLAWLHAKGLHITLNLHPADGVHPHEAVYADFAAAVGIDPATRQPVPFRIADKAYVQHYFEMIHHPMEDEGVDFWWMDWQQGEISEVKGLDPLPWINHLHFNDIRRKGVRPMLYSRWGGLGNHRYYIGFSGDTYVRWTALQFQPYLTAAAANVGYGWWSHDIGGHMGGATDPELYTRWVQFGALSPILRLHSTKDPRCERRPWAYPAPYGEAAMAAFRLRYRLIPYLYTMARLTSDTGRALCRPMYHADPETPDAYVTRYQYYLGTDMIAAPFVFPRDPITDLAKTDVWLPEGTWIAFDTLETFDGPRWVRLLGSIERMPLLVRAGAILPLAADFAPADDDALKSGTTGAQPQDWLELAVFPGAGDFRLYEDDGLTEAYRDGQAEWTPFHTAQPDSHTWIVTVDPVEGHCDALPAARGYTVTLKGCAEPAQVTVNGEPADWSYDAAGLTLSIVVPRQPKAQPITVKATADGDIVALGQHHNWRVALTDLECLVGETCPLEFDESRRWPWTELMTPDTPAFADAAARVGGPFASFIAYATPEEATQQLGHVILAAPAAGEPYDADVAFILHRGGQGETHTTHLTGATQSHVLPTPFAAAAVAPTQWEASVHLRWHGAEIRTHYRSAPLFPAIPAWRVVTFNRETAPLTPEEVLSDAACPTPALDWRTFAQTLSDETFQRAYFTPLWRDHWQVMMADEPLTAYLLAVVASPEARDAVIEFTSNSAVTLYLNGEPVAENVDAAENSALGRFVHGTRKTVPVKLQAGKNTLLVDCPAEHKGWPFWFFGAALTTPEGDLLADLAFT